MPEILLPRVNHVESSRTYRNELHVTLHFATPLLLPEHHGREIHSMGAAIRPRPVGPLVVALGGIVGSSFVGRWGSSRFVCAPEGEACAPTQDCLHAQFYEAVLGQASLRESLQVLAADITVSSPDATALFIRERGHGRERWMQTVVLRLAPHIFLGIDRGPEITPCLLVDDACVFHPKVSCGFSGLPLLAAAQALRPMLSAAEAAVAKPAVAFTTPAVSSHVLYNLPGWTLESEQGSLAVMRVASAVGGVAPVYAPLGDLSVAALSQTPTRNGLSVLIEDLVAAWGESTL